jgi:hypothetical protein
MAVNDVLRWLRTCAFCAITLAAIWAMHFKLFVFQIGAVDDPFAYSNGYLAAHVFARNLLPLLASLILLSPFAAIRTRFLYAISIMVWLIFFLIGDGGLYVADFHREIFGHSAGPVVWPRVWVILYEFGFYFVDALIVIVAFHAFVGGMRGKAARAVHMDGVTGD